MAYPRHNAGRGPLSITVRELFDRLRWFTYVRWVFGLFCLVLLLVSWRALGIRFRPGDGDPTMVPAVEIILLMFLYNAVFTLVGRMVRSRTQITRSLIEWIALAQILCDLVAICLLIHHTGGVANFFVIIILVPIAVVTELLPQRAAYIAAAVAAAMLNVVGWGEQQGILSHVCVEIVGKPDAFPARLYADPLYVFHVTAALTVTIFAMVFVASTIAARLRQREAELEEAHRQLRAVDEDKSFFMRKAEHEMRAPLGAIHSILDGIAHTSQELGSKQRELIGRAQRRCEGMMELVNDLLKYAQLRAPVGEPVLSRVCVSEIVADVVALLDNRARAAGVALEYTTETIWLDGDEERLCELVTNLVSNGIQYTPAGGRVDVRLAASDGAAVLTVADTGIGISEKALRKVFDEFYRAPEAKEFFSGGTGLGLAIVSRIAALHGGEIVAARRPERGSIFTVRLPMPRTKPPSAERRPPRPSS